MVTHPETQTFSDVEAWAADYLASDELAVKLGPSRPPQQFGNHTPRRIECPGRPTQLRQAKRAERTPRLEALREPHFRARTLHTFFHHELQAAELMAWALLAFSDAELEFRRGLVGICLDEIRHMNLYREHIEELGCKIGDFGVRDWFWRRVPACSTKLAFVSVMGMGLEAANLEYAADFASRFRSVGDETGAAIQERIAKEELGHVSFATHWFKQWTGGCDFERWSSELPAPFSPWVMHGNPIAETARLRAGMSEAFVHALQAYVPAKKGRPVPNPRKFE
ncbi:MAG TPA: DUF455 family protein [Polyangiaceae bacterium]